MKKAEIICAHGIMEKYSINRGELYQLIFEGKLNLTYDSKLYFNKNQVEKHFAANTNDVTESPLITIPEIVGKYGIPRAAFMEQVNSGVIKPIDIDGELNLYFGRKAIAKHFADKVKQRLNHKPRLKLADIEMVNFKRVCIGYNIEDYELERIIKSQNWQTKEYKGLGVFLKKADVEAYFAAVNKTN